MKNLTVGGVEFNIHLMIVIVLVTILPMLDWYGHSPVRWVLNGLGVESVSHLKAYDRIVYYLFVPLLVILLWGERPSAYGFQLGHWREGLVWTAVGCLGMSLILWFLARGGAMQSYYIARAPQSVGGILYGTAVDLFGWEFMWRGFALFALAKALGAGPAIWIQAIPFAFMHLGKPEVETLSTIFGGAAFAFVAWRTNSFVYPFLIHWYIASFTQLIASGRL